MPSTTTPLNIVFLDGRTLNPGDLTWDAFEALGHFTVYEESTEADVVNRAAEADVLILNKTPLRRRHIERLPRLRLVCVAATGYDVVDIAAAREHGIPVCNSAGYGTHAVAQMALAHLLEVTNRVGHYAEADRQGFWSRSKDFCCWNAPLTELCGKRAATVGYGHIGRAVLDLFRPLGMKLFAVTSKRPDELPADVSPLTLDEAFATCDVVTLNCPLTPDNRGFVNAELLGKARRGLILINTARGRLVDEEAVAAALGEGRLAAYGADVLAQEPPRPDNPLLSAPNANITPHIAWATPEARNRIIAIIAKTIRTFQAGGRLDNVVNN